MSWKQRQNDLNSLVLTATEHFLNLRISILVRINIYLISRSISSSSVISQLAMCPRYLYLPCWTMCSFLAFLAYQAYQFIYSGHGFLQYVHVSVCRSHAFGRCFLFWIFFSKMSSFSLFQFVFGNCVSILREPYSLNWYKFLISALSPLLSGMLHYRYFVTALKLLFTMISSAFV